ncbi:MAG: hypothetical protein ABI572_12315 [Actinomycetota bacterium]
MKAEFYREDAPDDVVVTATWDGLDVAVEGEEESLAATITNSFRRTPVVTDDGAYRRQGTSGEVQLQPGTLEWFRAVAQIRATAESGLRARLVPGIREGGFDPAAGYRSFGDAVERLSFRDAEPTSTGDAPPPAAR